MEVATRERCKLEMISFTVQFVTVISINTDESDSGRILITFMHTIPVTVRIAKL